LTRIVTLMHPKMALFPSKKGIKLTKNVTSSK